MTTEAETMAETHPFQAEVAELLRLMVHAVYSETSVFVRELISNASDACDKLRYEAIARPELLETGGDLKISVRTNADAGTLTISDTGSTCSMSSTTTYMSLSSTWRRSNRPLVRLRSASP